MPSPDYPVAVRGPQGWISTARNSSSTAKTTAIIGFVTYDLWLGHKTYHHVDFQSLYTSLPETSTSDHPRAGQSFGKEFHVPHVPPRHLRSCCRRHHKNCPSPIYIIGKESASSDCPHAFTRCPKLRRRWSTRLTRSTRHWVTCWHHLWRHPCEVSPSWRHLLTSAPPHLLTSFVDFSFDGWILNIVDFLQSKCSLPNFLRRFHFCSPFLHILLLNEEYGQVFFWLS